MEFLFRIIIATMTILVFLFYTFLSAKGIYFVRFVHKKMINIDKKELRLIKKKSVFTLGYALGMLSIFFMCIAGLSLDMLTYILIFYTFIISLVIGLKGTVFLTWKELKNLYKK